jgi:hypothetical protein
MCYQLIYLIFDFQDEATLINKVNPIRFFTEFVQVSDFRPDRQAGDNPIVAWEQAVSGAKRSAAITFENAIHYGVTFSVVTSDWRRLYIGAMRQETAQPDNLRALIQTGEMVYKVLKPDYGYGLISLDIEPLNPPGEGDYAITTVYDYNFYGPRLAHQLGLKRLLTVPAWRRYEFDDGGLLIEMTPNPFADRHAYTIKYQQAAQALDVTQYQQVSSA